MSLSQSIDANKTALVRLVAGMFALLGFTEGAVLGRIPRALHRTIINGLRPAESAVRRLIQILALGIKVKARKPRSRPAGLARTGKRKPSGSFPLFDTRQRFSRNPPPPKDQPRGRPSITFFRHGEWRRVFLGPEQPPPPLRDGLETSTNIVRRLQAIKAALDDLPKQALRMARALARREKIPHLMLKGPLRPGPAPGARKNPVQEIHCILERCHWLAREALRLDTS